MVVFCIFIQELPNNIRAMSGFMELPLLKFSTFTLTAGSLFYTALILLIAKIVEAFYTACSSAPTPKREIDLQGLRRAAYN